MSFKDIDKWPKIKMFLFLQVVSWKCLFNKRLSIECSDIFRKYDEEQKEKRRKKMINDMFNAYK